VTSSSAVTSSSSVLMMASTNPVDIQPGASQAVSTGGLP
jgi:hypothetical protein